MENLKKEKDAEIKSLEEQILEYEKKTRQAQVWQSTHA